MPTKCPKCDSDNTSDSKFCKECGTQLMPTQEVSEVTKTLETPVQDLTRGTKFAGRYQIVEKLGTGGMGSVYRVEDTKIHEDIALKLIRPEVAADKKTIERFSNELKLARKIRHKNVTGMYDLGETEGTHYITMEYISGEDLKSFIRRSGKLTVGKAISVAKQLCEGLIEAHKFGIVHRDLKPSNIMIDKAGNARIMDFGIARSMKGEALTGENVIIGTPNYMSPEQVEGKELDQRSDIYSLGVVLFEMLTGERPFKGDTSLSVAMQHKSEAPPNPKWLNDQIPDRLSRLVLKCLEKDKRKRYQSAEELLSKLNTQDEKKLQVPDKEGKKKSIVVLPFENLSPDPEQEYFCDGMTEEIISDLSKILSLRVISRTSAMMLKGTRKSMKTISRELDVKYVLEGSVRKAGNNLRITAQLIEAESDAHLWADKYSGNLDDVFEIQEKVSRSIVEALEVELTPLESRKISEHPTDNIQAYECYLRAYREMQRMTEPGIKRALKDLQNGLEILGENALLYFGLGEAYLYLKEFFIETDEAPLQKAEEYANRVFELEPGSSNAHYLLGMIEKWRGNVMKAIPHFERSLAIKPDSPNTLQWLSIYYAFNAGQASHGLRLAKMVVDIDPLTSGTYFTLGLAQWMGGQLDSALSSLEKHSQLDPESIPRFMKVYILMWKNQRQQAFECIDQLMGEESSGGTPSWVSELLLFSKYAFKKNKKRAFETFKEDARRICWDDPILPWLVAGMYSVMDEKEEALRWLEHAIDRGWINYPLFAEQDPFLENIRGEPHFKKLMERVKHEWENFEV